MQITQKFLEESRDALKQQAEHTAKQHSQCLGALEVVEQLLRRLAEPEAEPEAQPEDSNIVPLGDET